MLSWLFKILTGGVNVIDLYIALIIAGRRTIDQVPSRYRDAVIADLAALGLDENGQPL
ncbi:CD1375 family protein [Desulfofalx alkaliphila]|uniref:CD1375 family protein n=1 Tax=Desulfofalx alkaliphila TaxID=105483 RepID=UPI00146FB5CD|nr:CD1375 family protein [Desulfofalx alkaliphila]